jgi:phenylalanyl-tRNA synthetase beta subunit
MSPSMSLLISPPPFVSHLMSSMCVSIENIHVLVPYVYSSLLIQLSDQLRHIAAEAGYSEALTFALCRADDNFASLRRPADSSSVTLANPATIDFQVGRSPRSFL